jgi:thiol-disulfide isomerase/thioredoxin
VRLALFFLAALWSAVASAELRPFDRESPAQIRRSLAGRPYVLVLWSLDCKPCREEMAQWGDLQRKHPRISIVLVATDPPQERANVERLLARHKLDGVQTWMFADEPAERIRHAIDPAWGGELPRTYAFDADHRTVAARSDRTDPTRLSRWMKVYER